MIRRRILTTALAIAGSAMLSSCSLLDSVSEVLNVADVDFSSADPSYTGPTVGGPSWITAAAQLLLPTIAGGKTKEQVLAQYHLDITYHVKADNSKNTKKASFGTSVHPILDFRMNSKTAEPISASLDPFSVDAGQVKSMDFPVQIPLTSIDRTILKQILNGESIPYFLSGRLNFDLLDGLTIQGTGIADVDLATGAIPTRPTGDVDLAGMASKLLN